MNIDEIKNNLELNDIENLLSYLDADPKRQNDNIIISRTICHGGNSHKLYYYNNTKLFKCYTDCSEDSFDVGELIIKVKRVNGVDITLPQAVSFLKNFFNLNENRNENFFGEESDFEDWKILDKYIENIDTLDNNQIVELKHYDDKILKFLPHPRIIPWEKERNLFVINH